MEALHDPKANLTYTALTGARKQSVSDVERLFSKSMEDFMDSKGHDAETKYIRVIRNWRRACDERGLSDVTRAEFLHDFKAYIMDHLMPWHEHMDFSHLEVNRYVICKVLLLAQCMYAYKVIVRAIIM